MLTAFDPTNRSWLLSAQGYPGAGHWRDARIASGGVCTVQARLADRLSEQAAHCERLGSPLYAELMTRAADDARAGGVIADVLAGHEEDPTDSALALRLFGAVHRLVLEGRAPRLAAYYPSVGGRPDPDAAWTALRELLLARREEVRAGLTTPPQTNEVGRSAALIGGLLHVAADRPLPVRLVEIGASAGLNLRADAFRIDHGGVALYGPRESPVVLRDAWRGPLPPLDARLRIVARAGSDRAPVDPTDPRGALLLTSYVWADQIERLDRLRGALELARRIPAPVERAAAEDALRRLPLVEGTTTVVWHSVMWQYLSSAERAAVDRRCAELGALATPAAAFARLFLEPWPAPDRPERFAVVLRVWPGGDERMLGEAHPHGVPVTWS
jgi:hypothetical protein